jgi:hypothetical protein
MTATMAGMPTAAVDPMASTRARSFSRPPPACRAGVLCISLWRLSANRLVICCTAVDEWGCGKADNSYDASLARVGKFPLFIIGGRYPQRSL